MVAATFSGPNKQSARQFLSPLVILFAWLCCSLASSVLASNNVINDGAVDGIKCGDPINKISATFKSPLKVEERNENNIRYIVVLRDKRKIATFEIHENRIFMINVYDGYATSEGIAVGSTLRQALKAYGKGRITPTDQGYLVNFEKPVWLSLLLNDQDVPKDLRGIPDDVFTEEDETKILSNGKIRIVAIQIIL